MILVHNNAISRAGVGDHFRKSLRCRLECDFRKPLTPRSTTKPGTSQNQPLRDPISEALATFLGRPEVAPAGAPQKSCQRLRDWAPEGLILAGTRLRGIARCERFTENVISSTH